MLETTYVIRRKAHRRGMAEYKIIGWDWAMRNISLQSQDRAARLEMSSSSSSIQHLCWLCNRANRERVAVLTTKRGRIEKC